MNKYQTWVIELKVANCWVEDGFEFTNENIVDKLQTLLPYAYSHEVKGKILKSPDKKTIAKLQGDE